MVTWSHSVSIPIKTEFEVGAASNEEATGSKNLPRLKDRITEELVIGLVGPVGSGCTTTGAQIATILERDYGYKVYRHKLSDLIVSHAHLTGEKFDDNHRGADRISQLQRIGDNLRRLCGHGYLAAKAIERIAQLRMEFGFGKSLDGLDVPLSVRTVHIIDSLKNPNELRLLRDTYGGMFWLFGVFAPESVRKDRLEHHQRLDPESLQAIIKRDYSEAEKHGQSVRDVFHQADFFVRNDQSNEGMLTLVLNRYLEILFGYPVHTPNSDESAMAAAHAEASKSACLSRQVGAAIASPLGEIIGLGRNDVPRFSGGLYDEDDREHDHRCFKWMGHCCHNDDKKNLLYQQIAKKLIDKGLVANAALTNSVIEALKETDVRSLIEYSRAVHAEMDAIISVARANKAGLNGGTLYATTFPCHSCARHIVASGITKVLYIEPYPKSLALDLHRDAVSDDEAYKSSKVVFLQYSGVAPRNMLTFFSARLTRKTSDGKLIEFDKRTAKPLVAVSLDDFPTHEKFVVAEYAEHEKNATSGTQAALFES